MSCMCAHEGGRGRTSSCRGCGDGHMACVYMRATKAVLAAAEALEINSMCVHESYKGRTSGSRGSGDVYMRATKAVLAAALRAMDVLHVCT